MPCLVFCCLASTPLYAETNSKTADHWMSFEQYTGEKIELDTKRAATEKNPKELLPSIGVAEERPQGVEKPDVPELDLVTMPPVFERPDSVPTPAKFKRMRAEAKSPKEAAPAATAQPVCTASQPQQTQTDARALALASDKSTLRALQEAARGMNLGDTVDFMLPPEKTP
jgi:hypothetical protein